MAGPGGRLRTTWWAACIAATAAVLGSAQLAAAPGDVVLVSRADGSAGAGGNGNSSRSAISANGAIIAFESLATNLTGDPSTAFQQIYARNLQTGATALLSKSGAGTPANQPAQSPVISSDGLVIAFQTAAGLDPADTDGLNDIYVRDLTTGTTELISRPGGPGTDGNGSSTEPSISGDGNLVAFRSSANNLGAANLSVSAIFVRNRAAGTVTLVSRAPGAGGAEADAASTNPSISADGRFVAFASQAGNLSGEDADFQFDVFRRDLQTGETLLISRATGASGAVAQAGSDSVGPSISADGRVVAFESSAANLDPAITPSPGTRWVFAREVGAATTTLVSRDNGAAGTIVEGGAPSISADGTLVAFRNGVSTITRVRNIGDSTTLFLGNTSLARLASNGGFISLQSTQPLAPGENPSVADVFRYELSGATEPPPPPPPPPPPGGGGGAGSELNPAFAAPARTGALTRTLLDARGTTGATTLLWDLNGDGRNEIACGVDQPLLDVRLGGVLGTATTRVTTVRLTAAGPSGQATASSAVTVAGSSRAGRVAGSVTQPVACVAPSDGVVGGLPCRSKTIDFGMVSALGCFRAITAAAQVPAGERPIVDEAVRQFNASARERAYIREACQEANVAVLQGTSGGDRDCIRIETTITRALIDPMLQATDLHVSSGPVRVNGLTFTPQAGATIAVFPQIGRVISANAAVSLGGARLPLPTRVNVDVEGSGPVSGNIFGPGGRITLGTFTPLGVLGDFGGFSRAGQITVDLVNPGFGRRYSETAVSLALPPVFGVFGSQPPTARTVLRADNQNGLVVDAIDARFPEANLGGLRFRDVRFTYDAAGDRENAPSTCARRWWKATAAVYLGLPDDSSGLRLAPPPTQNGIAFCDGAFKSAGGELQFATASAPQVFPGVFLTRINFGVQLNPTLMRGGGRLTVASLADVDGVLLAAFPSQAAPYVLSAADAGGELGPLAGRRFDRPLVAVGGTTSLRVPRFGNLDLGNAYLLYNFPDYVALGGGAFLVLPGMSARLGVDGEAGLATGRFSLRGNGQLCILVEGICVGADAWVTSTGLVMCGSVLGDFHPGAGYRWGDTLPEIWFPDGCKPSGYWVTDVRTAERTTHSNDPVTFRVRPGVRTQRVRITGAGGAPEVEIRGPDGEVVSTAATDFARGTRLAVLRHEPTGVTWAGVANALPGVYTVTPLPGSAPIANLATSQPAAAPRIRASVTGSGPRRVLRYEISTQRGQRVTFFERGSGTMRRIGSVTGGRGTLRFTPAPAGPVNRRITALVEVGGYRLAEPTVARLRVPVVRVGRPGALRVRRAARSVTVSWGAAAGATRYAVFVQDSLGRQRLVRVPAGRRSLVLRGIAPHLSGTIRVQAIGTAERTGPVRSTRYRALRRPATRFLPFANLGRR